MKLIDNVQSPRCFALMFRVSSWSTPTNSIAIITRWASSSSISAYVIRASNYSSFTFDSYVAAVAIIAWSESIRISIRGLKIFCIIVILPIFITSYNLLTS